MTGDTTLNRRDFLKISAAAGGGLLISIYLNGCAPDQAPDASLAPTPTQEPGPISVFQPGVYLKIDSQGIVTITVHKPEVGQGVRTALPMIIAEELGADWQSVRVEQAPADPAYGNQVTGGSLSISDSYSLLRSAGAMARSMLIAAAAAMWEVNAAECLAAGGEVVHPASQRKARFGELVEKAAELDPIYTFELKDEKDFTLIGRNISRIDNQDLISGKALFGTDIAVGDMLTAVLARSPYIGGRVQTFDAAAAESLPGVRRVVETEDGIAVVAENTWQALQGRAALDISWRRDPQTSSGRPETNTGMVQSDDLLEGTYFIPHFAHASMEPMNCTADVRPEACEVFAPTQDPADAWNTARRISGLMPNAVRVHIPHIGGGFGRRLDVDYVAEAVRISQAVGAPIKLLWTREDDIQHDHFHPCTTVKVSARVNSASIPKVVTREHSSDVPTGAWRSVTNFNQAFGRECFMDEYAEILGRDPLELRLELDFNSRLKDVLVLAAEKAGWGSALPDGRSRGMACFSTWDATHVAEVAEVSISDQGVVRVHRVVCAVDCGMVINPNMVEAQMEGGIAFALTAATKNAISTADDQIEQSNFHDYPIVRMDEMPLVEVYIMPSDQLPSGVGEMAGPPLAPAVANAVYAASGMRIYQLPIRVGGEQT